VALPQPKAASAAAAVCLLHVMAVSFFATASFHSLLLHISKQSIFSLSDPRLSTISYLSFSQAASCSTISTTRGSSSSRFRTHTIFSTGVQVQRKHEFAHGAVAAVAMAGGTDVSHSGGEETGGLMGRCSHRPEMLAKVAYIPPSWASHLQLVPSHFYSLAQFPTPIHQWHLPGLPDGTEVYIKVHILSPGLEKMPEKKSVLLPVRFVDC
jgi:hypothetical protein